MDCPETRGFPGILVNISSISKMIPHSKVSEK
jgi:hypothetical protein